MCLCSQSIIRIEQKMKMNIPSRKHFVMRKYFDACKYIKDSFGMLKLFEAKLKGTLFNTMCCENNEQSVDDRVFEHWSIILR